MVRTHLCGSFKSLLKRPVQVHSQLLMCSGTCSTKSDRCCWASWLPLILRLVYGLTQEMFKCCMRICLCGPNEKHLKNRRQNWLRQLIPIITGHNLFSSYDLLFKFTEGHIFILTDTEMHTTFKTITNLFWIEVFIKLVLYLGKINPFKSEPISLTFLKMCVCNVSKLTP